MSQPLIKPGQVDSLPYLDASQKQQFKVGLANLWQAYEGNPEGSPAKQDAHKKLVSASARIMQSIAQRNRPAGAPGQPQRPQQNVGQPPGGAMQQGGQPQSVQQNQIPAGQPQGADPDAALKAKISAEVSAIHVFPSPEVTTQSQYDAHKTNFKTQLGTLRFKMEKHKIQQEQLRKHFTQLKTQGQAPSEDHKQKYLQLQTLIDQSIQQITALNQQNEQNKNVLNMRKNGGVDPANNRTPVNGDAQSTTPRPPTQQGLPGSAQQQQLSSSTASPAQAQAAAQIAQQRPNPVVQGGQQPQRQMPTGQSGQPQRPPINPQAAQQYASQYGSNPNSAIPLNAAQQRPHALSQQGAIAKAQEQNYQQSAANIQQQPQQHAAQQMPQPGPNGFNQPQAQTQQRQGTPTSATPHVHQAPPLNSKFPIPKNLALGPQTQTPVPGAPARPTMMNHSGVLNVPGIQKPPPFNLEGEGDHVLSKRKLDELVRQITGSTNPADGLTPEVEEAVLSLTDDFVDNVVTKACQMAKLRQGQTLELRDIQIVLERNYGIRIPGYALDEVRAVRKFQPSQAWISKVQAVQNAKIMGNNRDAT